jgi:imidazolonepropionase-like amidohydrolase
MRSGSFLKAVALVMGAAGVSQAAGPPASSVVLKAARLLDVRSGRYIDGQALLVEGERIKEVGPAAAVQAHAAADAVVVDLGAATLLPGLIDCHAHLLANTKPGVRMNPNMLEMVVGQTPSERAYVGAQNARETLEAGITSVRNVGHSGYDGDAASATPSTKGASPGRACRPPPARSRRPAARPSRCGPRWRRRSSTWSSFR